MINNPEVKLIYKVENIPLFQNKVYDTSERAINVERGNVELVQDRNSSLIHNIQFNQELMNYDTKYQNEQGNSLLFRKYLNSLVKKFEELGVKNKRIIEIGCGKGLFLEMLRDKGCNVIGFDPTYEGEKPYIIKEYFSKDSSKIKGEFIYLRHTLEHIPNPYTFIKEIAEANNRQGEIFIEVPTFDWIIENDAFYDIFYEHVNYFTKLSLSNMFHKSETGLLFNGQYIYIHANLSDVKNDQIKPNENPINNNIDFKNQIDHWCSVLNRYDKVYIWGAGAKGSTFLNRIDPKRELVDSVIDINPKKQNKFLGGTGHPIISPQSIITDGKTLILVMNRNYINEINNLLQEIDVSVLSI